MLIALTHSGFNFDIYFHKLQTDEKRKITPRNQEHTSSNFLFSIFYDNFLNCQPNYVMFGVKLE